MSKYTDADVARMLGWEFREYNSALDPHAVWQLPNGTVIDPCDLPCFGLSTPPGPEADANAARYVLPWIRENGMLYRVLECAAKGYKTNKQLYGARNILGYDFAQTLCTAALEAARDE